MNTFYPGRKPGLMHAVAELPEKGGETRLIYFHFELFTFRFERGCIVKKPIV
jgi:hypothetical protein